MTRQVEVLVFFCALRLVYAQCSGTEKEIEAASLAFRQNNLQDAEQLLRKVEIAYPQCSKILLLLARVQAAEHMPALTRDSLAEYTRREPNDPQGFELQAEFLMAQPDLSAAETAIRKSLAIEPDSVSALLLQGDILGREGRGHDAEAQQAFERACRLAPRNPAPYYRLGVFFDSRGRRPEAVTNFRKVVSLDPNNSTAWLYLALNLEQFGQPDDVNAIYQKGLAVNKGERADPFLPYHYGKFLLNQGRLEESQTYLDEAARLLPDNGAVLYQRARLYSRKGRYAEARTDAERLLTLPEQIRYTYDVQLFSLLTTIYERLGEKDLAQKYAQLARSAPVPAGNAVR